MLYTFGQIRAKMLLPGKYTNSIFNTQHGPTRPNTSQQDDQTRETCCTQQCYNLLRSNVVIVKPELANAGPTMLGCVVLKCCDRLSGALNTQH